MLNKALITIFSIACVFGAQAAKVEKYLPNDHVYNKDISKPEDILGFGIGDRHIRHDQLVEYMNVIANSSDRAIITDIGRTKEQRKQVLLTISHPDNLAKLDTFLENRKDVAKHKEQPVVVWLGYSVHGDEITGSNASLVVAYHLAASQHPEVLAMLKDTIIVMEPSINPDGMDRFATWVNTHRGETPNADPQHIEHIQDWRTGRTNHFGFDMNRDWLLLSQVETQNRIRYFHQYQPNVLGDYHEMGPHKTFFFQPGIPTRTHPFTPKENTELTKIVAGFHAEALDQENRLYFTEENYDDFYYGKGSTYPDINGGIGILFEQASSRGYQQDTVNGLLTFEFGIQNQVLTSFSTIDGSWKNKEAFASYRERFYSDSLQQAEDEKFEGYIVTEDNDSQRMAIFLDKLTQHQIKVYPLTADFKQNKKTYAKQHSYYIPLKQEKYKLIKALFDQSKSFPDNTFYDVSGWTLPLAMDIDFAQVNRTRGLKLANSVWQPAQPFNVTIDPSAYAYVFEWYELNSPKLLNNLLNNGVNAKVATRSFTATIAGQTRLFPAGSIVVPTGLQTEEAWQDILLQFANESQVELTSLSTGLTMQGADLGSSTLVRLNPVKALLIGGKGSSQYEAADIRFYIDNVLSIPLTVVEQQRLSRIDLDRYTHIIMVDGSYSHLGNFAKRLSAWVKKGGVVFGQKRAAKWLADNEMLAAKFASKKSLNNMFSTNGLSYQDKEALAGRKRIAGAIYESQLDNSHPLTYGYDDSQLPLFKNSTIIMDQINVPFVTVAQYSNKPLMSGYTDDNYVNRIANTPAIVAHNLGKGRVVATPDVLSFRAYWFGSAKVLANTLFFSHAFSASAR